MLAINHVTVSTASVLAASIYLDRPFFLPFLAFVVFASLLPDIDHPNSEISRFFPFISKILPHRGITHSIFATLVFGTVLWFMLGNYNQELGYALVAFALIGVFYLHKLTTKRTKQLQKLTGDFLSQGQLRFLIKVFSVILIAFISSLLLVVFNNKFREEILILLTIGYFTHLIGDFVTKDGIPLFWPINSRLGLKLFRTGSFVEVIIGFVLVLANVYFLGIFWNKYNLGGADYWSQYLQIPFLGG
jgi:inner membrane protein